MNPRLLVLTPRFPYPLYGGDVLRIYRLCEELSRTFRLTLLSICQSRGELTAELPPLSPFSEVHRVYLPKWRSYLSTLKALATGGSMYTAYYHSPNFQQAVERLQTEHDVVLCHLARTAPYAINFPGTKVLELTDHVPLIYARSNALAGTAMSLRKWIYKLEHDRVDRVQNMLAPKFDLVTFVSEVDRDFFLKSSCMDSGRVASFGNGVDLRERPFFANRRSKTIGFIGTLKALPNIDAVEYFITKVLPLIRRIDPDVTFKVCGKVDTGFQMKFSTDYVEFTGAVPNLAEAMADCVIGVCPVRIGAGIQNKMLDYMALGLVAVTTQIGAEGLEGRDGKEFLVVDDAQTMAITILSLLDDTSRRDQIALDARAIVESRYSWAGRLGKLSSRIQLSMTDRLHLKSIQR
jgi:glycosyltransferase involved in cell wall biosynthesis